ncbi:MAG: FTR1 family protein [Candidatus Micrarchaeota archaeon]
MLAEFIVMFRESLEAAFVVGIVLAYLHKTGNEEQEKHVWLGVASGIVLSLALAFAFQHVKGGFEENEELFEGAMLIATSALVSWLILWIVKQKEVVKNLRKDVQVALDSRQAMGIFLLSASAVLRESVEAVLFMYGIYINTGALSLLGGLLGMAAAVLLGILMFEYAVRFNIGVFFKATTLVLVLLAAGLFSQGIHELQEAGALPVWVEHVYDINPAPNPDGTFPPLHEKGAVGSILKGLVGYDGDPSGLQVLGYFSYLLAIYGIYRLS